MIIFIAFAISIESCYPIYKWENGQCYYKKKGKIQYVDLYYKGKKVKKNWIFISDSVVKLNK